MTATALPSYASVANSVSHVIPLTGKTVGRDVMVLFATGAVPGSISSPWIERLTINPGGSYFVKLWHLPAANNLSGIASLTIGLSVTFGLIAAVWEDDIDVASLYASLAANAPSGATPALWGTGVHTFTERDETLAVFIRRPQTLVSALDIASYNLSYTEFVDSGTSEVGGKSRIWLARKEDTAMAAAGVTATMNGVSDWTGGASGFFAYDVEVSALPPSNTVAPAITGIAEVGETLTCSTGTWDGDPIAYAYQWRRDGVDISGETENTYIIDITDVDTELTCTVTATNSVDSVNIDSNIVIPVAPIGPPTEITARLWRLKDGAWQRILVDNIPME